MSSGALASRFLSEAETRWESFNSPQIWAAAASRLHVREQHLVVLLSNQHSGANRIELAAHLTAPLYLGLIKVIEVAL